MPKRGLDKICYLPLYKNRAASASLRINFIQLNKPKGRKTSPFEQNAAYSFHDLHFCAGADGQYGVDA